MKIKEFTLTKSINNKTTIKTNDGSFKSSGGETGVSFTFGEGVDPKEATEFLKRQLDELKDPDPEWIREADKQKEGR